MIRKYHLHEQTNNDKIWDNMLRSVNEEDWQPRNHGFPEPELIKSDHKVSELYVLKKDSPTNDYLRVINEHFIFNDQQDETTSKSEVPSYKDI